MILRELWTDMKKRNPGRPKGAGSQRIEYRVTDAQHAELEREGRGNANAAAKAWTFPLPLFPDPRTVCARCDGTGKHYKSATSNVEVTCQACGGTGDALPTATKGPVTP